MKRMIWFATLLVLTPVACNVPITSPPETPTAEQSASTTVPVVATNTVQVATTEPTLAPTLAPLTTPHPTVTPVIGFSTGDLTMSIPTITTGGVGGPVYFCGDQASSVPDVTVPAQIAGEILVCLEGYPTQGVNVVRLELTGPAGPFYSEFYTNNGLIYDSDNIEVGRVTAEDGWDFSFYMPAWQPIGPWNLTSELNDGTLQASTSFDTASGAPYITMTSLHPSPSNPFRIVPRTSTNDATFYDGDFVFSGGLEIFFTGVYYDTNTTLTVALYRRDGNNFGDPLIGIAATEVSTDANGKWQTSYVFASDVLSGTYVISPIPDINMVLPFTGFFQIDN